MFPTGPPEKPDRAIDRGGCIVVRPRGESTFDVCQRICRQRDSATGPTMSLLREPEPAEKSEHCNAEESRADRCGRDRLPLIVHVDVLFVSDGVGRGGRGLGRRGMSGRRGGARCW